MAHAITRFPFTPVLLALVLVSGSAVAQAPQRGRPASPQAEEDAARNQGWRGLAPIEAPDPSQDGRPRTDAEAAGLRTEPITEREQLEQRRAQQRRQPWNDTRPPIQPLATPGITPPQSGNDARRLSSSRAPVANRRTGRLPPRPGPAPGSTTATPGGLEQSGLRPAITTLRSRPVTDVAISASDRRALLQAGGRGVAVPAQPIRPVDVPVVVERDARGRVLPYANPIGPNVVIDPRTGEVISYARRPVVETDPFAPVGLRLGTFVVTPTADTVIGFDSNPRRLSSGFRGSTFNQTQGEVNVRSDWSNHQLTGRLRGSYLAYFSEPDVNRPELNAQLNGRLDISRTTRFETEGRYNLTAQSAGLANVPVTSTVTFKGLPLVHQIGTTNGIVQDFGRAQVTLRGTVDRFMYDDAKDTTGANISQSFRNYNSVGARLRASYEVTPGIRPFVEAGIENRVFDQGTTLTGTRQGSTSTTYRVGSTFELSRLLTGEVAVGYLNRDNRDATFRDLRTPVVDASLVWTPTTLTTVTGTVRSTVDETAITGASGIQRTDLAAQVDHAFRLWLIGTARIAYGFDNYSGTTRQDQRMVASAALTYRASRILQIRGEVRHERLRSNQPGLDYTANVVLIGLRLQR